MSWTTPDLLRTQLQKLWNSGAWLAAQITGEPMFPRELRLRGPSPRELAEHFGDVRNWILALQAGSREHRGYGYELRYERINNRIHGANDIPVAAVVPTAADGLRLIGRSREAERFRWLVDTTRKRFPQLDAWLARRPLVALDQIEHWPQLLAVLEYFTTHPRPGVYLRQLDIPGVDTKFIETRRQLLGELLDQVLPPAAIDPTVAGVRGFERRYGLRPKPPLVRFRLLDPALHIRGLSDLSVPPEQFAALAPEVARVFITENEINGLALPDCPRSLVIFGLGYGLERLAEIQWLRDVPVYYWGDIDTHGFAILNRLRTTLPQARNLLMDRATLDAHRALWGKEPADKRFLGELPHLDAQEQALFDDLRADRLGERVRLEQERIGFGWLRMALAELPRDL